MGEVQGDASDARATAPTCARHAAQLALSYALVQAHYPEVLAQLAAQGCPLPAHVRVAFEAYLRCGVLEHGFLRGACEHCRAEPRVAFSCRPRVFRPSCGARRMAGSARHLVENVFGAHSLRQRVLSAPSRKVFDSRFRRCLADTRSDDVPTGLWSAGYGLANLAGPAIDRDPWCGVPGCPARGTRSMAFAHTVDERGQPRSRPLTVPDRTPIAPAVASPLACGDERAVYPSACWPVPPRPACAGQPMRSSCVVRLVVRRSPACARCSACCRS